MKKSFLVSLTLCASLTCQAGDYFFEPVFSANERYYSNLFLYQVPLQDNWISTLSPGLNFGLRHENGELKSNFTWNQLFYTNQPELDVSEQLFSLDYEHKKERLQWAASGFYNNRASTNTQGTVLGPTFTQVMTQQLSFAPTVSYSLDERSSLTFNYSYNQTTYDKSKSSFFFNYDYHQASATFNHLYTERDKLNLTISSSRYEAKPQTVTPTTQVLDQTTYNSVAQLGWQHSFSEQLVTYLAAGMNYSLSELQSRVPQLSFAGFFTPQGLPVYFDPATGFFTITQRYETVNTQKSGFGSIFQASIQKSFEKGSVSLVGLQNQTPTSQGLQTQTQLSIDTAYTINERWTSGLSASYAMYELTGEKNSALNRTYASIGPHLNWKWTPEINIGFSYTFRQQDYKNSPQASYDNNIQLQLTYQPQTNHQVK